MGYEAELKLFIDGAWRQGEGDASPVINPASGETIAELRLASTANLDEALAAAERAWPTWRALDVEKRGAILHKAASLLRDRVDTVARIMTMEQGKTLQEAGAVFADNLPPHKARLVLMLALQGKVDQASLQKLYER